MKAPTKADLEREVERLTAALREAQQRVFSARDEGRAEAQREHDARDRSWMDQSRSRLRHLDAIRVAVEGLQSWRRNCVLQRLDGPDYPALGVGRVFVTRGELFALCDAIEHGPQVGDEGEA